MNWIALDKPEQLQNIINTEGYSVIFKHSTRCPVSMMAKRRFEQSWDQVPEGTPLYFLDLIKYRDISNAIASDLKVYHESPQLLLVKNGECIYESSHSEISAEDLAEQMTA